MYWFNQLKYLQTIFCFYMFWYFGLFVIYIYIFFLPPYLRTEPTSDIFSEILFIASKLDLFWKHSCVSINLFLLKPSDTSAATSLDLHVLLNKMKNK